MTDSIISYMHDCCTGCTVSSNRHYLQTLAAQREAKTDQASAEREEMHRKSGHHTLRWNAPVRGSEGWRTPCPGKHRITSQITLSGSQRKAPSGKRCCSFIKKCVFFYFYPGRCSLYRGKLSHFTELFLGTVKSTAIKMCVHVCVSVLNTTVCVTSPSLAK